MLSTRSMWLRKSAISSGICWVPFQKVSWFGGILEMMKIAQGVNRATRAVWRWIKAQFQRNKVAWRTWIIATNLVVIVHQPKQSSTYSSWTSTLKSISAPTFPKRHPKSILKSRTLSRTYSKLSSTWRKSVKINASKPHSLKSMKKSAVIKVKRALLTCSERIGLGGTFSRLLITNSWSARLRKRKISC